MRVSSLLFAAAVPATSADIVMSGEVYGYVSSMSGVAASGCYTYSTPGSCGLESFQQYMAPTSVPLTYGNNIVYSTGSSYYPEYIALSDTLQNETSRTYDLKYDCDVPVYTPTLSYGATLMAPRSQFEVDESGNGTLIPEVKPLQMQALIFNTSDNYSQPNETYFRIYDIDMSSETQCKSQEIGPDVDAQRKMKLGAGSLKCAVRSDAIDSNVTGVVKSTHHALVQHDMSGGVCYGTDSSGFYKSCLRVISMTSYSNGTKGTTLSRDVLTWPDDVSFNSDNTCFYDDAADTIGILGSYRSQTALVKMEGLKYTYSAPTVTLVRTLEYPKVSPVSNTLMNIEGNIGFMNYNRLLAYSFGGDLVVNASVAVLGTQYTTMTYTAYAVNRTTAR